MAKVTRTKQLGAPPAEVWERRRAEGDGSVVEWEGTFEPKGVPEERAVAIIQAVYDAELANL